MESTTEGRLVPKDAIRDPVALGGVVEHEALVVFSTGVHDLGKLVVRRKDSKERLVEVLAVLTNIVSQGENVVYVCANHGRHVHAVLSRHHEEYLPVAPIHKKLTNTHVPHERPIIHAVVHEDKYWIALPGRQELLLTLDNLFKSLFVVVAIDEQVRNELLVVAISLLRSRHGDSCWNVLLVP